MERPLCITCQKNVTPRTKVRKDGTRGYKIECDSCVRSPRALERKKALHLERAKKRRNENPLRGSVCERCGFVPEHMCQLDVDHVDGNHFNNDPANLMTLCANCHRLKSWQNNDHDRTKYLSVKP